MDESAARIFRFFTAARIRLDLLGDTNELADELDFKFTEPLTPRYSPCPDAKNGPVSRRGDRGGVPLGLNILNSQSHKDMKQQ